MAVSHVFSNAVADWTGTVTVGDSAGATTTIAATDLVRPVDWNSAHNQFYTLTGNTSGNSTASGTNVLLSGGSNITLEGSASRIAIHGAGPPTLSFFDNMCWGATAASELGNATLFVFPFTPANELFPGNMTVSTLMLNISGATVSTGAAWTRSFSIAFYTSVNSTQLTRVFSGSTTFGTNAGNMNINDSFGGNRWLSIHSSNFDVAPSFEAGKRYWCAIWNRSSSGSQTFSLFGNQTLGTSAARSGVLGAVSVANSTLGWQRFLGIYSATFSTAMPAALAGSDINKSVAAVQFFPQVLLNNVGSNIV